MSLVSKPLEAITIDDLQSLIDAGARETAVLEFKGSLPVPKVGPAVDRWVERGDKVGDHARNELLAEIVAFSNADGGTLVLGLHETKDEPRCAERLNPLPNCEGLAKRLLDAAEDIIEPRLSAVAARGLPANKTGDGYVLIRAGKSLFGPHRLTTTRDFYIRRGERTARMTAREIRDHSYSLARAGDLVREMFDNRQRDAESQFATLNNRGNQVGVAPLLIRVSAAPMSPQYIDGLTSRPQLWWTGDEFTMKVDDQDLSCAYPSREFGKRPEFRLRSFVHNDSRQDRNLSRLLNSEGLSEFTFRLPWRATSEDSTICRLYYGWIFGLVVGVFGQVRHLQSSLAWDAIDFGLNISVFGHRSLTAIFWRSDWISDGLMLKDEMPLHLPQYEIKATTNLDELLSSIVRDISNACGISLTVKCRVPASAIANTD